MSFNLRLLMKETTSSPEPFTTLQIPTFNPWREITFGALLILELTWLIPWYLFAFMEKPGTTFIRGLLVLGSVLLVFNIFERLVIFLRIRRDFRRYAFVITLIVAFLASLKALVYFKVPMGLGDVVMGPIKAITNIDNPTIPIEFTFFLGILIVAYRGASLADQGIMPSTVMGSFRLGVVAFLLLGFFATIRGVPFPDLFVFLFVFLFSSLLGMSTARILMVGRLTGGQKIPFTQRRLSGLALTVAGMALLAVIIALVFSSSFGLQIFTFFYSLITLLIRLAIVFIGLLMLPFLILLDKVFSGVNFSSLINQVQQLEQALEQLRQLAERRPAIGPEELMILKPILLGLVILVSVAVVLLLLRERKRAQMFAGDNELTSLLSTDDLLRQIFASARKSAQAAVDRLGQMLGLHRSERMRAAARIRAIYADLLGLSLKLGSPRPVSRTPLEFQRKLEQIFPGSNVDLATITQAYQRIRYGEFPETRKEVDDVEAAWKRIAAEGQVLLEERKRRFKNSQV